MGLPTPHYYLIKHPPGMVASISVNDIPIYRRFSDYHQAPNGPFNHWMLSGQNVVHLVLVEPEPLPNSWHSFSMEVLRHSDDVPIFTVSFPGLLALHPEDERDLPVAHQTAFNFNEESPRPIWLDAPVTDFPPEGTPEQHQAVFDLHDAYSRGDVDAFSRAIEPKMTELARFYGPNPATSPAANRAEFVKNFAEPWDVRPLDFNDLMFERRGGGRTAYVTRKDGGPALLATHKTDPDWTWEPTLHMTQIAGRWTIFH